MSYIPDIAPWPKEFADKLPVSEMFLSIQGEGRFAGVPALFIRFKYCNLGCAWCDTRFTWDKENIEAGNLLTPTEIADKAVSLFRQSDTPPSSVHIVLTGGEPMLQQDRIPDLIDELQEVGFEFFEIETNGMYVPSLEMIQRISWWNCSPKLTNNGLPTNINVVPDALRAIAATGKADFKFVIQNPSDIEEIERDYLTFMTRSRIMLMPEGVTLQSQLTAMAWLMEECSKRGFRLSPRLHTLLWGNERRR